MAKLAHALQAIIDQYVTAGVSSAVLMVDAPDMGFAWKRVARMIDPAAVLEMAADDQFVNHKNY